MKIKMQIGILMGFVLFLPFLCLSEIAIAKRFRTDNTALVREFNNIKPQKEDLPTPPDFQDDFLFQDPPAPPSAEKEFKLDAKNDRDRIEERLRHLPPEREAAVIERGKVILSTIKELPTGSAIAGKEIWNLIDSTNNNYSYHFDTPKDDNKETQLLMISRENKNLRRKKTVINNSIFITVAVFIAVILVLIYSISTSLFNALVSLENQTENLAKGDFSTPVSIKHKNNQDELTKFAQNLETLRIALKSNKEKKSLFIMGISHDLRTPIAVIKGYLEALNDDILTTPEEHKNAYTIINSKINLLENMINELINYEKLDSANWQEDLVEINLYEYAKPLLKSAIINGNVLKRKVTGSITIPEKTIVRMNPNLVRRLVENLFSNAIRYTKEEGTINFLLERKDKDVTFSVIDNGCGMKQEDISKIFDLFYRSSNSRTEPGMGIGLTVVKNIVHTHGWSIDVDSELDKGTRFVITIPNIF